MDQINDEPMFPAQLSIDTRQQGFNEKLAVCWLSYCELANKLGSLRKSGKTPIS